MSKTITITLTVDAAELAAALATELSKLVPVKQVDADADKAKKAADAKAKKEAAAARAKAEAEAEKGTEEGAESEVTLEDLTAVVRAFREKHGLVVVSEVISKYASRFADVKPADYAALKHDIEAKEASLSKDDALDF